MSYNDLLKLFKMKEKDQRDQGEEFGERKTSIVHCHAMLLVHCMAAQMTTAIMHMALKECQVFMSQ